MIRKLRKWIINKRIEWAQHDRRFYKRHMAAAFDEIQACERREALLRQKLTEVDYPLPRGTVVRTRIGT